MERAEKGPITTVIEEGTDAMQRAVERCIDMLGSAGKA
jgi:fructose-bisphosphate aldolase, class II